MNYSGTNQELRLAMSIARRAQPMYPSSTLIEISMDVLAVHLNCCQLDLNALLKAETNEVFERELNGIRWFFNRDRCEFDNDFTPRFAKAMTFADEDQRRDFEARR